MGIEFNDQQIHALYDIENWWNNQNSQVYELSGAAGTGKTTLIRYFIDRIGLKLSDVAFVAYMGKAAMQMARNGLPAQTIHSLIYRYEKRVVLDDDGNIVTLPSGKPKLKFEFILRDMLSRPVKLIVLDEASMVNREIAKDILSFGIPIIALGDLNQLPPVFGNPYFLENPNYILTQVMRQQEGNPIVYLAHRVLDNKSLNIGIYGKNACVIHKTDLTEFTLEKADIVLTGTNKLRHEINTLFRKNIKNISKLDMPNVGEKIICRKNNWDRSIGDSIYLINGMTGYIDYVDRSSFNGKSIKIDFRPDFLKKKFKNLIIDYPRLYSMPGNSDNSDPWSFGRDQFEFAYAITTHACLPLNTLIYTEDGIQELGNLKDYNGKVYNGAYWEKPSMYIDNGVDKLNRLIMSNGMMYDVTDFHKCKVLTSSGILTKYGKDIDIGDVLLIRKGQRLYDNDMRYNFKINAENTGIVTEFTLPDKISTELAEILGMICSSNIIFEKNKTMKFVSHNKYRCHLFAKNINIIFNYNTRVEHNCTNKSYEVTIFDKNIVNFFYNMDGIESNNMHIPDCIMMSAIKYQEAFLEGFGFNHKTIFKSDNYKMINQLSVIFLNIGINVNIFTNKKRFRENDILQYELHVNKYNNDVQIKSIFGQTDLTEDQHVFLNSIIDNFYIVNVKKIETYHDKTACLEMPCTHLFIQNGFLGGNSQGSTYRNVVFLNERMSYNAETYKKLQYTAITRASEQLTIVL